MRLVLDLLWLVLAGFTLIPVSLFPLGKDIVPSDSVDAAMADAVVAPSV